MRARRWWSRDLVGELVAAFHRDDGRLLRSAHEVLPAAPEGLFEVPGRPAAPVG